MLASSNVAVTPIDHFRLTAADEGSVRLWFGHDGPLRRWDSWKLGHRRESHEGRYVEKYRRSPRPWSCRADGRIFRARASHPPDHHRGRTVGEFQLQHREFQPRLQR